HVKPPGRGLASAHAQKRAANTRGRVIPGLRMPQDLASAQPPGRHSSAWSETGLPRRGRGWESPSRNGHQGPGLSKPWLLGSRKLRVDANRDVMGELTVVGRPQVVKSVEV